MSLILRKIKKRLYRLFKRQIDVYLLINMRRNYSLYSTPKVENGIKLDYNFFARHNYLDESYPEVKNQFCFRDLTVIKEKYFFQSSNSIKINVQKNDGENWLVFVWNQLPDNYVLEFDYYPSNVICEFQLAFNYYNLRNRNRFLVLENRKVLFDLIKDSCFYPIIYEKDMTEIFDIGKKNHVVLSVTKNLYEFRVNNILLYAIEAKKPMTKGKDLAFILWEDKHNRPINCRIDEMKLYRV